MLLQILTIARVTFIESLRQPVMFVLVLFSGVLQIFNTWNTGFSMGMSESGQVSADNKLLLDIGLGTIFICGTLLAGFIATAVMSREIENKTVLTIVSKPVSRAAVVLGKYVGVAGAICIAVLLMLIFMLLAIRHGVMSTAADELDMPVIVFSAIAVFLAISLGAWCNYFYGMNFPQTSILILTPLFIAVYIAVLVVDKNWKIQPITKDFKDQVMVGCAALGLAILVLSSVATAASTRLGQVMTIMVCLGVLLLALLSNYFIGRHVFTNPIIGIVETGRAEDLAKAKYETAGETHIITLRQPPNRPIPPGTPFYFSPSPSGYPVLSPTDLQEPAKDISDTNALRALPIGLVVTKQDGAVVTIRTAGGETSSGRWAGSIEREPLQGDFVFTQTTKTNYLALAVWGAVPNMQSFWLLDAISQNRPVPASYLLTLLGYAAAQTGVFLSLGVLLFQKRDVG
jgi:ABC-2 type transport system permease protein